jgi:hypothetical protein
MGTMVLPDSVNRKQVSSRAEGVTMGGFYVCGRLFELGTQRE